MLYLKQAAGDSLPEITTFLEDAFQTVSFSTLLPKLYAKDATSAPLHTILYEDAQPVGLYCLQVQDFSIEKKPLRVGFLGSVCVAPNHRGKGYLTHLMQHANQCMRTSGCDIGVLGGQRQRYERFGYAPAGEHWVFTITPRNFAAESADGITVLPFIENMQFIPQAQALYRKEPVYCNRGTDAEFLLRLQSWQATPYVILNHGIFSGYCTISDADNTPFVTELCVTDSAPLPQIAQALPMQGELRLQVYPWQTALLQFFAAVAEQSVLVPNHSYHIFNWAHTANAVANNKKLTNLEFILEVKNETTLLFQTTAQKLIVQENTTATPHLTLSRLDAIRLLFAPDSALISTQPIPAGLFPLPLAFSWVDGI